MECKLNDESPWLTLRVTPEVHRELAIKADEERVSINQLIFLKITKNKIGLSVRIAEKICHPAGPKAETFPNSLCTLPYSKSSALTQSRYFARVTLERIQ